MWIAILIVNNPFSKFYFLIFPMYFSALMDAVNNISVALHCMWSYWITCAKYMANTYLVSILIVNRITHNLIDLVAWLDGLESLIRNVLFPGIVRGGKMHIRTYKCEQQQQQQYHLHHHQKSWYHRQWPRCKCLGANKHSYRTVTCFNRRYTYITISPPLTP